MVCSTTLLALAASQTGPGPRQEPFLGRHPAKPQCNGTAQKLAAGQYERLAFPGLARGQRLVARDEARHIGIGVSYARRRMEIDPERARAVIGEIIAQLMTTAGALLETANNGMAQLVVAGYGVHPQACYDEAMRLTQLRLRSIGFLD
jgi:hypothetical protein